MSAHCLSSSPWFPGACHRSTARLRLFCLPYAGGSASIFRTWAAHLPETVDVCPVQLPGRGARLQEAPFEQFSSLVGAVATAIAPYLDMPFAFFGHSLGGLVAFEIIHRIRVEHLRLPVHLIVSGCTAPRLGIRRRVLSTQPEQELVKELRYLNGTPSTLLENGEFLALTLPSLRADFALYESYRYTPRAPLECPITGFGGMQDREADRQQLEPWGEETRSEFSLHLLRGDHFFLHSAETTLLALITRHLYPLVRRVA